MCKSSERPQADALRRPPPEGVEETSGGRAFPHEATRRGLPPSSRATRPHAAGWLLCALAAATLQLAVPARAGVTRTEAGPPPSTEPDAATPVYQLRCWQNGRLLFEEYLSRLPADGGPYGLRINGSDRHQRPLYVAETQNATCLIRSVLPERGWPRSYN